MLTPHEIIGTALEQFSRGVAPFFEAELQAAYGPDWPQAIRNSVRGDVAPAGEEQVWDSHLLLTVMWDHWNAVFRQRLGLFERSLVSELREFRNRWAHQVELNDDDALRVVDTVQRLLQAVRSAPEMIQRLDQLKWDLLRDKLGRKIDDDLRRAHANRARMVDMGLYGMAALSVIITTILGVIPKNPVGGTILCGFTIFVFGYIMNNRWQHSVPVHGVHECRKCRKIVYSEICPYCEAPPDHSPTTRSHDRGEPSTEYSADGTHASRLARMS